MPINFLKLGKKSRLLLVLILDFEIVLYKHGDTEVFLMNENLAVFIPLRFWRFVYLGLKICSLKIHWFVI
jgi:hypothetical protein